MSSHPNAPPLQAAVDALWAEMNSHPHEIMASTNYQNSYTVSMMLDIIAEMPVECRTLFIVRMKVRERFVRDEAETIRNRRAELAKNKEMPR